MYNIILVWARIFLRLYFRRTIVHGREYIPARGPLIVASNHPSAFMEASVLATLMGRQLHFLVRGDVFHPRFRWLFRWTNQIPIYRQKDGISNLRKNASSFDLTYQRLAEGDAVIIFPEAKTVLEKKMRPIQRGTAHLAFGTLPYLKEGEELHVLPVGVNFTDPRLPGTDVVIRYGQPFATPMATREDRDAIEAFTQKLSEAMDPLIVQVEEHGYEKIYDVLSSIYLTWMARHKSPAFVHDDLKGLEKIIREHAAYQHLMKEAQDHVHQLKKDRIQEAAYYPRVLLLNRFMLFMLLLVKSVWFIAGGWIWRGLRGFIFTKIRSDTFQGPTSVGAAMVVFLLLSLVGLILCFSTAFACWILLAWWIVLAAGKLFPAPLHLVWKTLWLVPKRKSHYRDAVSRIQVQLKAFLP